jgi:Skp family chaperone for outer membrane proteins
MKQLIQIIFFLIFSLFFNSVSYSNTNIVFLDIEYAVNNSNIGKKVLDNLKKTQIKENKKLKIIEQNLKDKDDEIKKVKNVISKDELKNKIDIFKKSIQDYNIEKDKVQKNFIKSKNKELDELIKKINPLIVKYMEDKSIDLILSKKIIYLGNTNLDITEDVLGLINVNFK